DAAMPHLATGANAMHHKGIVGEGINIGIVDSGIDYTHLALGGKFGPGHKVAHGYDFVGNAYDGTNDPKPSRNSKDCACHGTKMTGIIGAQIGKFYGIASGAIIGAYKVGGC
ncbi:peptidase S8/S53 domain-containing protein, partial [Syncephalis fuscata]